MPAGTHDVNETLNNGVQMPALGFDLELTTGVRAAPEPDDASTRSRRTCQRMAGSPSSSQPITLTTAGYRSPTADPSGGGDMKLSAGQRKFDRKVHADIEAFT